VPTLIATTFFGPQPAGDEAFEDFEAAEGMDAGALTGAAAPRSLIDAAPGNPRRCGIAARTWAR
jgi:hypothetical protein